MSLKHRLQKREPVITEEIIIPVKADNNSKSGKLPYISYAVIFLVLIITAYLIIK